MLLNNCHCEYSRGAKIKVSLRRVNCSSDMMYAFALGRGPLRTTDRRDKAHDVDVAKQSLTFILQQKNDDQRVTSQTWRK